MITELLRTYSNNATSVNEIITPLRSVGIVGVFYTRIYPDGTIINLANDADWTEFYFNQLFSGIYKNKDIVDQFFIYSGASLWALNSQNPIWQDAKSYFGYENGVTLIEDKQDFREAFCFYSTSNNHAMNHFYINQIDTIKKMKQYFLSQSVALIQQAERERLLNTHPVFSKISDLSLRHEEFSGKNIISSICVFHKKTGLPIQLSPQRSQCLLYLMEGKSTKEIAQVMNLSSKTVDHYLEFLRKELDCRSSKELIIHYAHQVI